MIGLTKRKRKYRCGACLKTVLRISDKNRVRSFCNAWRHDRQDALSVTRNVIQPSNLCKDAKRLNRSDFQCSGLHEDLCRDQLAGRALVEEFLSIPCQRASRPPPVLHDKTKNYSRLS